MEPTSWMRFANSVSMPAASSKAPSPRTCPWCSPASSIWSSTPRLQATAVIPIVFAAVSDPVGTDLVASLARPGGNITGLANQTSDTAGKKLEFLREAIPDLRRLAIMANVGNPASVLEMGEAEAAARKLGLEVTTSEIRRANDIAPAFKAL